MTPAPAAATPPPRTTAAPIAVDGLAGSLRTEVNRLAYHLRTPAASSGITPTRLAALSLLARHRQGCRAGDLALEMGVSPASMTRLIDILAAAEWVRRHRDEDDARATILTLTTRGAELLEGLRRESTSQLSAHLSRLGERDRRVLAEAVPILRAIADAGSTAAGHEERHG